MTGATSVSILVPRGVSANGGPEAVRSVERFLETTGFSFEILAPAGESYGSVLRRGVSEANGRVIVVVDPDLPYDATAIGDAVAMIESGATDVLFAVRSQSAAEPALLRWLLVPNLPDPALLLCAFTADAARLVIGESKLDGPECHLEIAYLANKYGFRVEKLRVEAGVERKGHGAVQSIVAALRIGRNNRRMAYRAPRRCPVCFSTEVWTCAQIYGNVVRACGRCKCRYLNQFLEQEPGGLVRRVLRSPIPLTESPEEPASATAREKTSLRRLAGLRKQLMARARILEVGVRDGSFGLATARDYEYVGIDRNASVVRQARSRGLEVYCSTLSNFVNTGPSFDAIALFHVLENMPEPHDALARMKDLLKPGGLLFLTTFDTEGLIYLLSERKRMAQNFRTHRILYSRSALIELLEHSGFEIDAIGPDFHYRDHRFLRYILSNQWPILERLGGPLLRFLPDPLLISSGSIRIIAKRRAGVPLNVRPIRSAEPTHAR